MYGEDKKMHDECGIKKIENTSGFIWKIWDMILGVKKNVWPQLNNFSATNVQGEFTIWLDSANKV